ncbi:MAG: hypothetical protein QMC90_00450 [Dehalococcoidales bacterium]|nr:hypothetical protein [Dehalococcoidales bacterium]
MREAKPLLRRLSPSPFRIEEGEEELGTLVETVEEGIAKRFPNTQIVRRKAPRELFGGQE